MSDSEDRGPGPPPSIGDAARQSAAQDQDPQETLEWLDRALEPWPLNFHFLSNVMIELDGDRATSRCYFNAPMGRVEGDGQLVITNCGWYDDELVRTDAGWRISRRVCEQTIMIGSLPEGYEIPS